LHGVRGFFRFPFLLVIPTGVTVGLAYLVTKFNPYIIHSSEYAVWSMMISAWVFSAWFVSRVADFARPSAFHRVYTLTWLFLVEWVLLVISTVYENKYGLAGGYFVFFAFAGTFLATWISYLELFALPRKSEYATQLALPSRRASSHGSRLGTASGEDVEEGEDEEDDGTTAEATETTSLLRGQRTTFANYVRVTGDYLRDDDDDEPRQPNLYGHEQAWSIHLPKWVWVLQFLLTAPLVLIFVGPLALLLTSALRQTGQDGSSSLFIYIAIAALTTLLFMPLLPFIHRYTHHIPLFLLCVFAGTLIYNLFAFPFSPANRLKLFFIQEVDLDTGVNHASLSGAYPFVHDVASFLPSAAGQNITCDLDLLRPKCSWHGIPPQVVQPAEASKMEDWLSYNITKSDTGPKAQFSISGRNTRACKLVFDRPVRDFKVADSAYDPRFPHVSPDGTKEIRLWTREWGHSWTVEVEWSDSDETDEKVPGLSGRVVCLWSDENTAGVIPALDEVRRYVPVWVGVSKLSDGLVEGSRRFQI
jgi:hypothetical protein